VDRAAHDELRRRLLEERERTAGTLGRLSAPVERGAAQGFGKRIGDGTIEAVSRLTDIGVGRSAEVRAARVERALQKLEEGSYERCDGCGATIPAARLQAMPSSTLCTACSAGAPRRPRPRR
jgi:DnaK suppressor protein